MSSPLGDVPLHWWRLGLSLLLGIVLPVVATELCETPFGIPEGLEWAFHSLVLVAVLVPLFYFLWYRPLSQEMNERRRVETEVRRLSRQAMEAGEEECRRLGRDLHDDFGQKLVALQLRLDLHREQLGTGNGPLAEQCDQMLAAVRSLQDDLRQVVVVLSPPLLDDLGLVPALEAQVAALRKLLPDLQVELHASGLKGRLPEELETALFRVCQEALTNVVRHARATRAEIWLTCCHPAVILVVEDNGVGMANAAADTGAREPQRFGLLGMRERVAAVGGTFRVQSAPGQGTRLRVEIPLSNGRVNG